MTIWGIDKLKKDAELSIKAQEDAILHECQKYANCFNTPEGQHVLLSIKKAIDSQPTWNPDLDPKYGYFREGQNDVLRHIQNRIDKATKK